MAGDTTTIYRSKLKMGLLLLGSLAFVLVGIFVIWVDYGENGAGGYGVFVGILTILFFGFCGGIAAYKTFDRKPAVVFLPDGLVVPDIASAPIGWRDIHGVRFVEYERQPIIEIALSPEAEASLPFTRMVKMTRGANRGLGFQGVCLSGLGLTVPPADVARMIGERAEQAQATG